MGKAKGASWSLDEALAGASLPTERFPVLFDQALSVEIEELEAELLEAQEVDARENRAPEAPGIANRIVELHEEAKAKQRVFVFQALPAGGWSGLLADHPPVTDLDKRYGFAFDSFTAAAIEACCLEPKLQPGDAERIKKNVSEAIWFSMFQKVKTLNEVPAGPKSVSRTALRLASVPRSTSPAPSDSQDPDSLDE